MSVRRGDHQVVNDDDCTVIGRHCVVNGDHCRVQGDHNVINGDRCTVDGRHCVINGDKCTITGSQCIINGSSCIYNGLNPCREKKKQKTKISFGDIHCGKSAQITRIPGIVGSIGRNAGPVRYFVDGDDVTGTVVQGARVSQAFFFDGRMEANDINGGQIIMGGSPARPVPSPAAAASNNKRVASSPPPREEAPKKPKKPRLPDEYKDEPEAKEGEKACVICMERASCTLIKPCRHACLCVTCARRHASPEDATCPVCQKRIERVERIFSA